MSKPSLRMDPDRSRSTPENRKLMALTDTTTATYALSPEAGRRPRIWALQYGPCWCHGTPAADDSFDFVRLRTARSSALNRDVIIVSQRVIVGSGQLLRQVHDGLPSSRLVVTTGNCPSTDEFWDSLPGGWVEADELIRVDAHVEECFSRYPEVVLARILEALDGDSNAAHAERSTWKASTR